MKKTALIMAGGRGERFWPKSRTALPKQFLSLTDDGKTMIQLTIERILPLVSLEDIFIATNQSYKALVLEQIPGIPEENILCEPVGRNTAPCIGLGAFHIRHKYPDAVMMVLPSDHLIKYPDNFREVLQQACHVAESGENLVTIGISPNYPETGYGYIKYENNTKVHEYAFNVDKFVEKPDYETASFYLSTNEYLWNSGMFIWKVSTILKNIKEFMPETFDGLAQISQAIKTPEYSNKLTQIFSSFNSESIDYGIMEKASNIFILPGNFGWDDVGSWLALSRINDADSNDNIISGNVITVDTSHCIINSPNKLVAAVGVDNLVIVDTNDATLICHKDNTADIKKVIEQIKFSKMDKYL